MRRGGTERGCHLRGADRSIRINDRAHRVGGLVTHLSRVLGVVGNLVVLIDSLLHLLQDLVHLLKVVLGAQVRHRRKIVVLGQGSGTAVGHASHAESVRWLGHVLGSQTARLQTQRGVEGHERAANLLVRSGIDLATLDTAEEFVQVINATLPGVKPRLVVVHEVAAGRHVLGIVDRGLVIGLARMVVVAAVAIMLRLEGGRVSSTHLAIVIIETGGSWRRISLEETGTQVIKESGSGAVLAYLWEADHGHKHRGSCRHSGPEDRDRR